MKARIDKKGPSQVARKPRTGGRVQAAHHDPEFGEKDRVRGLRKPGGERVGAQQASRPKGKSGRRGGALR